ncbi:MAG: SDR family NAD(P)-dependent oxidoreductase [Paracoccus sp. (in: a-proteobacteria)]|uniref:SDR family NAD(P)-dependent oxidoreductase n=1 Tax=Paracoccus sp. TaxID=267 RepID=UPI0026E0AFEC|nr:SDR family NAD(P)-dependent oxidoreductase [Paracoccus sp. (in: a-proteobacteria)]MDO5613330.1 SDR family NAD(P)-dependent oxidoreductase [Paracoccus sp. (in: a-proteobacteria)]
MARIFVTGSTTGLGLNAGRTLLSEGHDVIFHARNAARAQALRSSIGDGSSIVIGDISTVAGALDIADQVNALGPPDAVIHNAGLGADTGLTLTSDGIPDLFGVNVLAPYVLTASIPGPTRLVYLSSDMHFVTPDLDDMLWRRRSWSGYSAYSESKFFVTALAFAVARLRPDIYSNAVDPGWVPTRMGGRSAPDDLEQGATTQAALASGTSRALQNLSGAFLYHMSVRPPQQGTRDTNIQSRLLELCRDLSGIRL